MTFTTKKVLFNQIIFMICVIVPFFNNYELSFLTWILAILLTLKNKYSISIVFYLCFFALILALALFVGYFNNSSYYFKIRDITYLLKPLTGLLLGYQLYSNKIKNPWQFLVYAGVAIASYHLLLVLYALIIEGATAVNHIRFIAGYFNDFEVYALIVLIFSKKLNLDFSRRKTIFFLSILAFSSFFYLARTNFIQFIILVIALKGYFVINIRAIKVVLGTILVTILAYSAIVYYNPVRNGKGVDEFLYKIKMAPKEAFSTKINRFDWKAFNDNYRSYENIRTVQQLLSHDSFLFGEGIGSKVDLKQKLLLGDTELRYISILHNGYMTVLLKSGFLGLLVYLFTTGFFFINKNPNNNETLRNINFIFVGTGVFLIISNWVFMGFYNPVDTKSLFIGFLFAYKNEILKNHALPKSYNR